MSQIRFSPDRFSAVGVTLKAILLVAYDLKMEEQVSGLTGPMAEARFDVEAKVDEETMTSLQKLPLDESANAAASSAHDVASGAGGSVSAEGALGEQGLAYL